MPSHGKYCKVHFYVVAQTELGQSVYVSGSGSTFVKGNYKPSKAIQLHTTPSEYPVWHTLKPILIPRGTMHTYQYAVFNGGAIQSWEDIPPRTINCSNEIVKVEDEYNLTKKEQKARFRDFNGGVALSTSAGVPKMLLSADEQVVPSNEEKIKLHDELKDLALKYTEEARSIVDATSLNTIIEGRGLVLACFHLPVHLNRDKSGTWSATWNDSLIARSDKKSVASDVTTTWIGTVNAGRDRMLSESDRFSIRKVLAEMGCIPIFATQELIDRAYLGFCKQQLWPSFHNVDLLDLTHACWNGEACVSNPELSWDQSSVQGHWEAYEQLNAIFAEQFRIFVQDKEKSPKGAVLWAHDYHLMLLPRMVADKEVEEFGKRVTKIVFFLNIPFSTSQIFRSLQYGHELLEGMVHSDAIGFHAFDHARHFLNACKRNLGLKFQTREGGLLGVEFEGRTVSVLMRHVSIEPAKVDREKEQFHARDEMFKLQEKHKNKKMIAGLDTCQRLSGVALKLLGFETLLDECEKWRNEVVLVQRCTRPRNRLDDEERTSFELNKIVQRINAKYPGSVDYEEIEGSTFESGPRLGLWLASDVMLNTAVRESLNMNCLEYIYAKKDPGVLVASEFGSTVSVLSGSLRINPFDLKTWKNSLDEALRMPYAEREARKYRDLEYVISRPSAVWTKQILNDMMLTNDNEQNAFIFSEENEDGEGTGEKFQTGSSFSKLNIPCVCDAYQESTRRLFVFDFAGTLREKERVTKYIKNDDQDIRKKKNDDNQISKETLHALKKLSEDTNNTVYIISEKGPDFMEETFRDLPNVGLAARDGLCYSVAAQHQYLQDDYDEDMDDSSSMESPSSASIAKSVNSRTAAAAAVAGSGMTGDIDIPDSQGDREDFNSRRTRTTSLGSLLDMTADESSNVRSNFNLGSSPSSSYSSNNQLNRMNGGGSVGGGGGGGGTTVSGGSIGGSLGGTSAAAERSDMMDMLAVKGRDWYTPDLGVDWPTIKSIALPLLNRYTGRTNGSSIRFREPSLSWSYYRADPDEGIMQATKLKEELTIALAPFNVQIQHGVGELDIIPISLHQGAFMKHVMQITTEANNHLIPDFMLVIGDGASDERMFSSVLSFVSSQFQPPKPSKLFIEVAAAALQESRECEIVEEEMMDRPEMNKVVEESEVNIKREENEQDDEENPLSVAAELMLDEKPIRLAENTEKIINEAASLSLSNATKDPMNRYGGKTSSRASLGHSSLYSGNKMLGRRDTYMGSPEVDTTVFTCTVGKKASCAGTYIENVEEVKLLLQALSKVA